VPLRGRAGSSPAPGIADKNRGFAARFLSALGILGRHRGGTGLAATAGIASLVA
jgi:hypothetical protein